MIGKALAEPNLLRLYGGVFTLHMMLTALFLVIPPQLRDSYALQAQSHWQVYLPVMLLAMGLMVPFIVIAEKQHKMKQMLLLGIVSLMSSLLLMGFLNLSIFTFAGVMVLFFAAFNLLEAIMPSWVSKVADAEMRGTAMGVFASSQFAGAFFGGLMGGWIHQHYDNAGVFIFAAIMALLWLLFAASLKPPRHLGNYLLPLTDGDLLDIEALKQRLLAVKGVATVHILTEDAIAYMKVDNEHFDSDELAQVAASEV
jgi:MFS family permease